MKKSKTSGAMYKPTLKLALKKNQFLDSENKKISKSSKQVKNYGINDDLDYMATKQIKQPTNDINQKSKKLSKYKNKNETNDFENDSLDSSFLSQQEQPFNNFEQSDQSYSNNQIRQLKISKNPYNERKQKLCQAAEQQEDFMNDKQGNQLFHKNQKYYNDLNSDNNTPQKSIQEEIPNFISSIKKSKKIFEEEIQKNDNQEQKQLFQEVNNQSYKSGESKKIKLQMKELQGRNNILIRECSQLQHENKSLKDQNRTNEQQIKQLLEKVSANQLKVNELNYLNQQMIKEMKNGRMQGSEDNIKLKNNFENLKEKYQILNENYERKSDKILEIIQKCYSLMQVNEKLYDNRSNPEQTIFSSIFKGINRIVEILTNSKYDLYNMPGEEPFENVLKIMQNQKNLEVQNIEQQEKIKDLEEELKKEARHTSDILPRYRESLEKLKSNSKLMREKIQQLKSQKEEDTSEINQLKISNREIVKQNQGFKQKIKELEDYIYNHNSEGKLLSSFRKNELKQKFSRNQEYTENDKNFIEFQKASQQKLQEKDDKIQEVEDENEYLRNKIIQYQNMSQEQEKMIQILKDNILKVQQNSINKSIGSEIEEQYSENKNFSHKQHEDKQFQEQKELYNQQLNFNKENENERQYQYKDDGSNQVSHLKQQYEENEETEEDEYNNIQQQQYQYQQRLIQENQHDNNNKYQKYEQEEEQYEDNQYIEESQQEEENQQQFERFNQKQWDQEQDIQNQDNYQYYNDDSDQGESEINNNNVQQEIHDLDNEIDMIKECLKQEMLNANGFESNSSNLESNENSEQKDQYQEQNLNDIMEQIYD